MTASTSSAKPCQSKLRPSGDVESPCPRSSNVKPRKASASDENSGVQTWPWNPVACANSSGGPSPPSS